MSSRRTKAYVLLLATAIIWGLATSVIKFTLAEISPFSFLTYRFFISGIIAVFLLLVGRIRLPKKKSDLAGIFAVGIVGNTLALGLLFVGLAQTTVLDTSIIEALAPLLIGVMGVSLLHDRVTRKEKLGIFVALVGTLITIIGPLGDSGIGGLSAKERSVGNLIILMFVVADATSFVMTKKLTQRKIKPDAISNFGFVVAFITTFPIILLTRGWDSFWGEITQLPFAHHLGVWYMAIVSGTLAYWFWTKGQKSIEVSEAAVFRYLIPVFATPLAIFWIGEKLTLHFLIGAGVVFFGVGLAEYKGNLRKKT